MTRAINPTGSMLLDRSSAQPGSIDKSVFEKKSGGATGSAAGQGTVNPNYLKECREDNPEPAAAQNQAQSVTLGACKITTPPDQLVLDQPFEMSVEAKSATGQPSGQVTFQLFCTIPDSAGSAPKCEDQSLSFSGTITDGIAKVSGKLVSPKKPVPAGTRLQYHVVAEHPDAKEKSESPKVEVVSGKPPKPLAVWSLGAVHFGFDSSFILPSAAAKIAEFKNVIAKHQGAAVAVFGHADPVGEDDANKGLSGRRAFAVWCLLAKDPTGWTQLANTDKWDLRTTQTMLSHLKGKTSGAPYYGGSIDGKTGPKTESAIKTFRADHSLGNGTTLDGKAKEGLYKAYMESVCEVTCKPEDFVGDPKDPKRQWACVGCSEFNPVLVFAKSDDARFRNASDKTERNAKNAPNRRTTVFLFPPGTKGPGNVEFPCPQWSEGVSACRKQFFEDADMRRNPSDAERTWEKDKDTFACKFYAELGEAGDSAKTAIQFFLHDEYQRLMPESEYELQVGNVTRTGKSDLNGKISEADLPALDEALIRWGKTNPYNPPTTDPAELNRRQKKPMFLFERKIVMLSPETVEMERCDKMLRNLGYVDENFPTNWTAFQFAYGIPSAPFPDPATLDALTKAHDMGAEPPLETQPPGPVDDSPEGPEEDGIHADPIHILLENPDGTPASDEPWELHDASGQVLAKGRLDTSGRSTVLGIDNPEVFLVFPHLDASSLDTTSGAA